MVYDLSLIDCIRLNAFDDVVSYMVQWVGLLDYLTDGCVDMNSGTRTLSVLCMWFQLNLVSSNNKDICRLRDCLLTNQLRHGGCNKPWPLALSRISRTLRINNKHVILSPMLSASACNMLVYVYLANAVSQIPPAPVCLAN